jgi:hypothetical protein
MTQELHHRAETVGLWAGTLSIAEVGLGSILHGFHLPLGGTLLSLNQCVFLTRATRLHRDEPRANSIGFEISSIAALLKSFSPLGKKLTPMLAIASQGALFSAALFIFGTNLMGVMIGATLLAAWGIAQPLILAGVVLQALSIDEKIKITHAWEKMTSGIAILETQTLTTAILILLAIKCSTAAALAAKFWSLDPLASHSLWSRWENFLRSAAARSGVNLPDGLTGSATPWKERSKYESLILSARDLKNPFLLVSIVMLMALSILIESDFVPAIWLGLRALAAAYVFYLLLRIIPWHRVLGSSQGKGIAISAAIRTMSRPESPSYLAKNSTSSPQDGGQS